MKKTTVENQLSLYFSDPSHAQSTATERLKMLLEQLNCSLDLDEPIELDPKIEKKTSM